MFIKFALESAHVIINIHSTHTICRFQNENVVVDVSFIRHAACQCIKQQIMLFYTCEMRIITRDYVNARARALPRVHRRKTIYTRSMFGQLLYYVYLFFYIHLCMWPEMPGDSLERKNDRSALHGIETKSQSINALWGWWTILIVAIPAASAASATKSVLDFLRRRLRCRRSSANRFRIHIRYVNGNIIQREIWRKWPKNRVCMQSRNCQLLFERTEKCTPIFLTVKISMCIVIHCEPSAEHEPNTWPRTSYRQLELTFG